MKKTIKQHDITDCGAACLASIAAHYKLALPIARIRQLASTDQKGTNLLGMIQVGREAGFSCKGVRAEEGGAEDGGGVSGRGARGGQ